MLLDAARHHTPTLYSFNTGNGRLYTYVYIHIQIRATSSVTFLRVVLIRTTAAALLTLHFLYYANSTKYDKNCPSSNRLPAFECVTFRDSRRESFHLAKKNFCNENNQRAHLDLKNRYTYTPLRLDFCVEGEGKGLRLSC